MKFWQYKQIYSSNFKNNSVNYLGGWFDIYLG